jgi:hypothetical protein
MTRFRLVMPLAWIAFASAACTESSAAAVNASLPLATSTENFVAVTISLESDAGQAWLSAAFAPTEPGFSLYSKDLPRKGVDGVGRPTLLEIVAGSRLQAMGSLCESVEATRGKGAPGLLLYPPGPVILRLPVALPEGEGWFDDFVSVTYVVCSGGICKIPVEGKVLSIRIPGFASFP